jgi:ligand-binding sensor domain-containing protein
MRTLICAIIIIFSFQVKSQVLVGQWRTHLPYSTGINVEPAGDKVYCLSTGGLFVYSKKDNSTTTLTKINGLSDVVISALQYIPEKNTLIIGYENGNIDLIKNNVIFNISDIYRKPLTGSKSINNINYINGITYLSCGFGIVVLDIDKNEIKDTYFIGQNGTYIDVLEMCSDNVYLYAATSTGIYKAIESNPNLVNFANWSLVTNIPNNNEKFNHIVFFDNHILTTYSNPNWNKDTTYIYDNISWAKFDTSIKEITNMVVSGNKLILSSYTFFKTYNSFNDLTGSLYWGFSPTLGSMPKDAEYSEDGTLWIADYNLGLVWLKPDGYYEFTAPNGPAQSKAISVVAAKDEVLIVPGGKNSSWNNLWNNGEIYWFKDQRWNNISVAQVSELDVYKSPDICEIAINPINPKQVFFGSYGGGVLEFNNGAYVAHYTETNSTLQSIYPGSNYMRIGGIVVDENENLWVTSSEIENSVSVRKPNGEWKGFALKNDMGASLIGKIISAKNGIKWIILPKGKGLFAFSENGTIDNESDDKKKYVSIIDESGVVITNEVFSLAEDKDGLIWVGTNKGVVFFYNPENVFESTTFYAQQIKIPNENPGQANFLLEAETVTAIAIDGANHKWFGTESGGVFMMSADATKELLHFTKENSPLLSNTILGIAIEPNSGEVFIATDKGVVSYRSTTTEGEDFFHNVYAFPNPVKPGYEGLIAIKGLVSNADIKISDIAGNVVYQTKAEGGQATWNGKKFNGEKVQTGVYLVFCSNEDGSKTFITKILFIN